MNLRHPSLRKAAILVACLDQRTAELVLAQLPAEQADHVRRAILRLGDVDNEEQDDVIDQFVDAGTTLAARINNEMAGIELDGALAERIVQLPLRRVGDFEPPAPKFRQAATPKPPFRFLHETHFETLIPFLRREHPQTIAVVISHLPAVRAGEVLSRLPGDLQADVVRRLSSLNEMDPEALAEVERGLERYLNEENDAREQRSAGMTAVAAILDAAPATTRQQILGNLSKFDRTLAGKLRPQPHTFDDVMDLPDDKLREVLDVAKPDMVVLALAGAPAPFVERTKRLLPLARAKALSKALAHLGPARLTDIDDAKQALADLIDKPTTLDRPWLKTQDSGLKT